ncbi:MAG: thiopurine S-methyltransferase [Bdellovibrionaceae bacterium]|nr:thiopurine S-methyltransferase [Pseudobdellovibrionaceae bacterium]
MDPKFWHQRWQDRQIGFHRADVNPLLADHVERLSLKPGQRIFVPLCGKSVDLGWLRGRRYSVVGAELHEPAVQELFQELGVTPEVATVGNLKRYRAPGLEVFAGDLFDLAPNALGPVEAVYDRAALVALPEPIRRRYASHLLTLTDGAPQLLITYTYDQTRADGPPFSVTPEFVTDVYAAKFTLHNIHREDVDGGLKGLPATETVWLLTQK